MPKKSLLWFSTSNDELETTIHHAVIVPAPYWKLIDFVRESKTHENNMRDAHKGVHDLHVAMKNLRQEGQIINPHISSSGLVYTGYKHQGDCKIIVTDWSNSIETPGMFPGQFAKPPVKRLSIN